MYKLFLCLRYLRRRRIAFFAVAAVCLCVAMVLIVVSVMDGFLQMVKDRSRGMLADLVVENDSLLGFPFYDDLINRIKTEMPNEIHEATPVIITFGVLRFPVDQITKAVQIVGIKLKETYEVNDFKGGLFYEKYYPGTTTLDKQGEPAYGYDGRGNAILPPDLEAAWQKYLETSGPGGLEKARQDIDKEMEYQRPGYYRRIPSDPLTQSVQPAWLDTDRTLPGIIFGTDLVADIRQKGKYERYYWRGMKALLTLVPFNMTGSPIDSMDMPKMMFRYADDGKTGIYDIDSMSVYVDFDLLQSKVAMNASSQPESGARIPARTTQIQIKLKIPPGEGDVPAYVHRVREKILATWNQVRAAHPDEVVAVQHLDRVKVRTWEEKQERFIGAVKKEKVLVTVLFGVISVVAVFLVGCIFYMIVQQKTRDIGVVKSVGATSWGVAGIFLAYGAAVGVVGGIVGSVLGTLFVRYINEVQALLIWLNPSLEVWDPRVYSFDRIPNHVEPMNVVYIYLTAIVASMLGSVIAAVRAARIWPVESLRYE
ncbi:MAG: ABC transporter permease [Phycisphaerae bacterium]|nr:ABC transporter permease [Phycisphaerae bacterium]